MPDLALPTVDGRVVRLSDYRGRRLLVWQQFVEGRDGDRFALLSAAVDADPERVRPFAAGLPFPTAVDSTGALGRLHRGPAPGSDGIDAGAPDRAALDHHDAGAQLGRLDRGREQAQTGPSTRTVGRRRVRWSGSPPA